MFLFRCFLFQLIFSIIFTIFIYFIFLPIFQTNSLVIQYGIVPFDICVKYSSLWAFLKLFFIFSFLFSAFIFSHILFISFSSNLKIKNKKILTNNNLQLFIGFNSNSIPIYLPEKSLFQNILITGTIGTGKTSSAMYPFTSQLISYQSNVIDKKLAMLILDVKGNYYYKVKEYTDLFHRFSDLIVIEPNGLYTYNPLDKPHLKASVIAHQLKEILLLFSPNNTESYWLDMVESILTESIKFCRLYNDGYVTFQEIHKLITSFDYFSEKIDFLRNKFISTQFDSSQNYNLLSSIQFLKTNFFFADSRNLSILRSEITRITNFFISDYDILHTFSPEKNKLNFFGFKEVLEKGKIVVLRMNINEYKNLSKIIAAYLKLDFQTEVLSQLSKDSILRPVCFVADEYGEYVTISDANFFSQSREAKCINIVATQSYTSLLNALHDEYATKVIIQNLVNKLWFRNDDIFTIEDIQKQIGKVEKEYSSNTITENAKETNYNYFTNSLHSKDSNLSESFNTYLQLDYQYDFRFFTQNLESFQCLSFLSNGYKILNPEKLIMVPYFKREDGDIYKK